MKKKSRLLITRKNTNSEEKGTLPDESLCLANIKNSDGEICNF